MSTSWVEFDGVYKVEYKQTYGALHKKMTQPSESIILQRNSDLRNDNVQRDLSFGRQVASIPLNDFEMLCRKYPDLKRGTSKDKQNRLMKILGSSEGKRFLVRDRL